MEQKGSVATGRYRMQGEWARFFGYDIFISFALGPEPRGCRAYASDLARQLRERGFTVFFSEDEAPAGSELDRTLKRALHRSRLLVVIVNRAMLAEPRWVRTEVEEYRRKHPTAPIVPIDIGGALREVDSARLADAWLNFRNRIWIDETEAACRSGHVSDDVIVRLVTAPHAVRSRTRLRIALAAIIGALTLLSGVAWQQRTVALGERDRALEALLTSATQQALLLSRDGRAHEGWEKLAEALAAANPQLAGALPAGFLDAALTTLVEDRRGPDLLFDTGTGPVPPKDDLNSEGPAYAFDAAGTRVAVSAHDYIAVWSTADGRRLAQVRLPFVPERLTFADDSRMIVAEGTSRRVTSEGVNEPDTIGPRQAAAVSIEAGSVMRLPLSLCRNGIPCVGESTAANVLPLARIPGFAHLQSGALDGRTAYLASAAENVKTVAISQDRFVVTQTDSMDERRHRLVDLRTGQALSLDGLRDKNSGVNFNLARDAPVLAAGSSDEPLVEVFNVLARNGALRVSRIYAARAQHANATQGIGLDPSGKTLRYQVFRYGTGTGVGIGATIVIDLASGAEKWTRGEGTVAWGGELSALREDWADIQVISSATGATVFTVPGELKGIDPTNRMMLIADWEQGRWPSAALVELLPVKRFTADTRGPASMRSACPAWSDLRFVTLAERLDRIWNRNDWHRAKSMPTGHGSVVSSAPTTATDLRYVQLNPTRNGWEYAEEEGKSVLLTSPDVKRRFPELAWALQDGEPLVAALSSSPDKRWHAVTINLNASAKVAHCEGPSYWQLYRSGEEKPFRSGCTKGETPGAEGAPGIHFIGTGKPNDAPLLIALPVDVCAYQIIAPGREATYTIHPAFANQVSFERTGPDLLTIRSQDWYGSTRAYQLHQLGAEVNGPVFVLAERNNGSDGDAISHPSPYRRVLFPEALDSSNAEVTFSQDGSQLQLVAESATTLLGVPPWGERLRQLLMQSVQRRKKK